MGRVAAARPVTTARAQQVGGAALVRALLISALMRKHFTLVAGIVLATLMLGAAARAAGGQDACVTYRTALQRARQALGQGDRQVAIAALRQAKVALVECRREEARMTNLLAAGAQKTRDA
jgi:hypothetical protein